MSVLNIVLTVVLSLIVMAGVVLLIRALYEPHTLRITYDNLDPDASSSPDISICFFSDLHAELCFITPEKLITAIDNEHQKHPIDLMIFGGDICNKPETSDKGVKFLQIIKDYCSKNSITFAGVTGNHDVELSSDIINSCGFINLNDEDFSFVAANGKRYFITGIKDSGRKNRIWHDIRSSNEASDATILIAHNPDYINHLKGNTSIDYLISGHIHGGQIRTPFNLEFKLRKNDELPKSGIYAGHHIINGCKLFISRGLGCVVFPFRLGSYPEVNFIRIKKG